MYCTTAQLEEFVGLIPTAGSGRKGFHPGRQRQRLIPSEHVSLLGNPPVSPISWAGKYIKQLSKRNSFINIFYVPKYPLVSCTIDGVNLQALTDAGSVRPFFRTYLFKGIDCDHENSRTPTLSIVTHYWSVLSSRWPTSLSGVGQVEYQQQKTRRDILAAVVSKH